MSIKYIGLVYVKSETKPTFKRMTKAEKRFSFDWESRDPRTKEGKAESAKRVVNVQISKSFANLKKCSFGFS